jgi:ribosomal-protein-alanine N-acetyltransferase
VVTERVVLAAPRRSDATEFVARAVASDALHRPWVAAPTTVDSFHSYVERTRSLDNAGFLVRARDGGQLVGVVNVNNIVLGALRSGHVGYYAFAAGAGRGLMTEAVRAVVDHAFGPMGLHRLEANIQPGNARSLALAQRCGFRHEGYSPRYLFLDGAWRDHERWAVTAEDVRPSRR